MTGRERERENVFDADYIERSNDLVSRNKNPVKSRYQLDKPTHEFSFFSPSLPPFFFSFFERIKNRNIEELRVYGRVYFERQDRE